MSSSSSTVSNESYRSSKKRSISELDDESLNEVRLKVNSRERKRMHDLNAALDELRDVIPYANGPNVRKLSKMATLLLAKNYILMLTKTVDELKQTIEKQSQLKHITNNSNNIYNSSMDPASQMNQLSHLLNPILPFQNLIFHNSSFIPKLP